MRYSQILASGSETIIDNLNKGNISIGSAHASLKKEKPQQETITKTETTESEYLIILKSIDEGKQKIANGDIDVIMVFDKKDKLDVLKKNPKIRIGVYYLE